MTVYSPGSKSTGSTPRRSLERAWSARASASIADNRQPELCAHPDEFPRITTVEASARVDRCSAKIPFEFATPMSIDAVVIEPAAEQPSAAALRQIAPTRIALCSGVH